MILSLPKHMSLIVDTNWNRCYFSQWDDKIAELQISTKNIDKKKRKVMGQDRLTKKFDSFRKCQKRPFICSVYLWNSLTSKDEVLEIVTPQKQWTLAFSLVMSGTTLSAFVRCELIFQYRIMRQTRFVIMAKLRGDCCCGIMREGFVISIVKVKTSTIFSQGFINMIFRYKLDNMRITFIQTNLCYVAIILRVMKSEKHNMLRVNVFLFIF